MSSEPAPEIIIREAIALSSCDPDGACPSVCGSVPPIDNCLRHQAISAVRQLVRERDEARAENKRLRGQRDFHDDRAGVLAAAVGIARLNLMEGESGKAISVLDEAAEATSKMYADARAALAAAQEPPAYTPAPECPRCGLFLAPGEVHGEHEVGCVARGPAPRDEIRHLRERLDAQTNVLGWIRDTFPDATDCWGEDVRLDSSECEPPAEGGDR